MIGVLPSTEWDADSKVPSPNTVIALNLPEDACTSFDFNGRNLKLLELITDRFEALIVLVMESFKTSKWESPKPPALTWLRTTSPCCSRFVGF